MWRAGPLATGHFWFHGLLAEAPVKETITFSDTFQDEFLTEACGVAVTTTANGRLTFFTFPDRRGTSHR